MMGECFYDGSGMEPSAYFILDTSEHCGGFFCKECEREVDEAETVEIVTACYEDEWRVYVTCQTCKRIRDSLYKSKDFTHGELWKAIHDRYGLTPDGVDEDWIPPDRRASNVEVSDSYEHDLNNLPPGFEYKPPEEIKMLLQVHRPEGGGK